MVRECIALGTLARKSTNGRRPGDSPFRREFIRGAGLQLFELQRQLIDQTRRALRSLPIVCTENLIRVDEALESPKLAE